MLATVVLHDGSVNPMHPDFTLPVRRARKWRRAFNELLEATHYARDLGCGLEQFAIGQNALIEAGLTVNDLRWLVAKGWVRHLVEQRPKNPRDERTFRSGSERFFTEYSCFLLSDVGCAIVNSPNPNNAPLHAQRDRTATIRRVDLPRWDPSSRTLWFGLQLVKQFKVPAVNQELVLAAFAEEEWPSSIHDPLPPTGGVDPKRRLHDTIIRLNRSHRRRLLRFHGNGNGLAICWEPLPDLH